jgi:hypothetical protein
MQTLNETDVAAITPAPANDIEATAAEPAAKRDSIDDGFAKITAAERSLYDAVISHWCHRMNQFWGPNLSEDLEAYADHLETRAAAVRKAKAIISPLISTI